MAGNRSSSCQPSPYWEVRVNADVAAHPEIRSWVNYIVTLKGTSAETTSKYHDHKATTRFSDYVAFRRHLCVDQAARKAMSAVGPHTPVPALPPRLWGFFTSARSRSDEVVNTRVEGLQFWLQQLLSTTQEECRVQVQDWLGVKDRKGFGSASKTATSPVPAPAQSPGRSDSLCGNSPYSTSMQKHVDDMTLTLTCPITQERMVDPVVAADGHTYERTAIAAWLDKDQRSPMTGLKLSSRKLQPNYTVRGLLENVSGLADVLSEGQISEEAGQAGELADNHPSLRPRANTLELRNEFANFGLDGDMPLTPVMGNPMKEDQEFARGPNSTEEKFANDLQEMANAYNRRKSIMMPPTDGSVQVDKRKSIILPSTSPTNTSPLGKVRSPPRAVMIGTPVTPESVKQAGSDAEAALRFLRGGAVFKKHCKAGLRKRSRWVWVEPAAVGVKDNEKGPRALGPRAAPHRSATSDDEEDRTGPLEVHWSGVTTDGGWDEHGVGCVGLSSVVEVVPGAGSETFRKHLDFKKRKQSIVGGFGGWGHHEKHGKEGKGKEADEAEAAAAQAMAAQAACCFSLVLPDRTLDLQAESEQVAVDFVSAMEAVMRLR